MLERENNGADILFLKILKHYQDIVNEVRVEKFRTVGLCYQIKGVVILCDDSELHVKDYFFQDSSRKYSYHWQTKDGKMIGRWDNAPHWPDSETFPHHFHNGKTERIEDSEIRDMENVMKHIRICLTDSQ